MLSHLRFLGQISGYLVAVFQPRVFHHQVMCKAKLKMISRQFNVRCGSRTHSRRWRTVNQSATNPIIHRNPRARCNSSATSIEACCGGAQVSLLSLSRHNFKASLCEWSIYLTVDKRWTKFGAVLVGRRWLQLQVLPFEGGRLT